MLLEGGYMSANVLEQDHINGVHLVAYQLADTAYLFQVRDIDVRALTRRIVRRSVVMFILFVRHFELARKQTRKRRQGNTMP